MKKEDKEVKEAKTKNTKKTKKTLVQRCNKIAPKWSQHGPKIVPKWPQVGAKAAPRGPKRIPKNNKSSKTKKMRPQEALTPKSTHLLGPKLDPKLTHFG